MIADFMETRKYARLVLYPVAVPTLFLPIEDKKSCTLGMSSISM